LTHVGSQAAQGSPGDQRTLALLPEPLRPDVTDDQVGRIPTFARSILYMIDAAGLTDTEIATALDIDKGHMSRVRGGSAHFPTDKIPHAMGLCDSDIPLRWLAMHRGIDPGSFRRYESDLERELRETREELAEMQRKAEAWKELLRETGIKP